MQLSNAPLKRCSTRIHQLRICSKNPAGQKFGPCHQRTECIENLSPSWDETHYDMDLVGNDWLNLTPSSQYLMDRFLDTTLSGGTGDQYDPTRWVITTRRTCRSTTEILIKSGRSSSAAKAAVILRRYGRPEGRPLLETELNQSFPTEILIKSAGCPSGAKEGV